MQNFESELAKLINEFDPEKIDLSHNNYYFEEHEKANINRLPFFINIGNLTNNSLTLPALLPFIENKGLIFHYVYSEEGNAMLFIQNLILQIINRIIPNKIDIIIYDPAFLGAHFSNLSRLTSDQILVEILTNEQSLNERFQKYIKQSESFIKGRLLKYDGFVEYWEKSDDVEKELVLFFLNDSKFSRNPSITDSIERISKNSRNNNSFFILSESVEKVNSFSFFKSDFIIGNNIIFYNDLKLDLEFDVLPAKIRKNLAEIMDKQSQDKDGTESNDIKEGVGIPIGVNIANNMIHFFRFGLGIIIMPSLADNPGKGNLFFSIHSSKKVLNGTLKKN